MVLPGAVGLALLQVDARRHVENVVVPVEDVVFEVAQGDLLVHSRLWKTCHARLLPVDNSYIGYALDAAQFGENVRGRGRWRVNGSDLQFASVVGGERHACER